MDHRCRVRRSWLSAVIVVFACGLLAVDPVRAEALEASDDAAALWLPSVFGDHMVLQRDKPLPVWGRSAPGADVTVRLSGEGGDVLDVAQARAGADGRWRVTLAEQAAGGPYVLQIEADGSTRRMTDVLVGEVWLCSGQSNMDWSVSKSDDAEAELAASGIDRLRLFRVERDVADAPLEDVVGAWAPSGPQSAARFSAVGYFLGQTLEMELGVPVGVIQTAYGGTPIEAWTPWDAMANHPETASVLERFERSQAAFRSRSAEREAALRYNAQRPPGARPMPLPPEPTPLTKRRQPAGLYHAMLRPLAPYALRGVAWYQGESNVWRAVQYRYLLTEMIQAWRRDWRDDTLPFAVVQLPSYANPPRVPPGQFSWAELRESQLVVSRSVPNVGLIVTTDVGDPNDIHPTAKRPVGERVARWALAEVYGYDKLPTGPLVRDFRIEGDRVIIRFEHAGSGLSARDGGAIRGFCIAGPDQRFRWAQVEVIDTDTLAVSEAKVPDPRAVRYGWDENIPWANLVNDAGLPASPFRTDQWERVTEAAR